MINDSFSARFRFFSVALLILFFTSTIYESSASLSPNQKIQSNKIACTKILNKSIKFEQSRQTIANDDYAKLRSVYRSQALFIDSFYYKTFGEVADAMATLRDNIWQVADRSADMNRELNSTQNSDVISGLDYAINQSMSFIKFDTVAFANACRSLKGFKFKKDIFTIQSLEIVKTFATSFGCDSYSQSNELAPFAKEWGQCQFESTNVKLYDFKSIADLRAFIETVKAFGIQEDQLIIRGLRIIAPDDSTKLSRISEKFDR